MVLKRISLGAALLSLSACASQQKLEDAPPLPTRAPATKPNFKAPKPGAAAAVPTRPIAGADRVMGRDARSLILLFGQPVQDVREPAGRKLQFGGTPCILDAYLYPPEKGREPVVTHVDARTPDGRDAERSSCITALTRSK